jgi:hypothetical protein
VAIYTQADEIADLGAILFRMMTGIKLPRYGVCSLCGCTHVRASEIVERATDRSKRCQHDCWPTYWPYQELKKRRDYSDGLCQAVADLMSAAGDDNWWRFSAGAVLGRVWELHLRWRFDTADGAEFRDIYDDHDYRSNIEAQRKAKNVALAKQTLALPLEFFHDSSHAAFEVES